MAMREGIVYAALGLLAVGCWLLVIGHQLGWPPLQDPDRSEALRAVMFFAYIAGSIFAAGVVALAMALWLSKPQRGEE